MQTGITGACSGGVKGLGPSPIVPIAYVFEHTVRPHSRSVALALGAPFEARVTDTGHGEVGIRVRTHKVRLIEARRRAGYSVTKFQSRKRAGILVISFFPLLSCRSKPRYVKSHGYGGSLSRPLIRWGLSPIPLPSDARCQMSLRVSQFVRSCPLAPDSAGKMALDPPPNNAFWLTASNCDQSSLAVRTNRTFCEPSPSESR